MERKRIEYPGAFYHVIQRGNNRENIFRRDTDKRIYLENLASLTKKFDFRLLGFVLMDNHYHLLLKTGEDPLHKIIFRQNMFYSRYFNKSHQRSGHLYGDRYKASIIQDERYLIAVLRYIHWNPVKAGLNPKQKVYSWSSDYYYRSNKYGVVDIDFILKMLSPDRKVAIKEYLRLMEIEDDPRFESMKIVGDEIFIEKINEEFFLDKNVQNQSRKDLSAIFAKLEASEDDKQLIKCGSRKRHLRSLKKTFVEEAVDQGYSYHEIGKFMKMSGSAIALYRKEEE